MSKTNKYSCFRSSNITWSHACGRLNITPVYGRQTYITNSSTFWNMAVAVKSSDEITSQFVFQSIPAGRRSVQTRHVFTHQDVHDESKALNYYCQWVISLCFSVWLVEGEAQLGCQINIVIIWSNHTHTVHCNYYHTVSVYVFIATLLFQWCKRAAANDYFNYLLIVFFIKRSIKCQKPTKEQKIFTIKKLKSENLD